MKRKIIPVLLCAMIASCAVGCSDGENVEDKKNIRWKELAYYAVDADGNEKTYYEYTYDEYGNFTHVIDNLGGQLYTDYGLEDPGEFYFENEYDGDKLISVKVSAARQEKQFAGMNKYVYFDDGNLQRCDIYDEDMEMKAYWEYTYDSDGNKISEKRTFYRGGGIENVGADNQVNYVYDDNGNMVKREVLWEDGSIMRYTTFAYNEDNHITEFADFYTYDEDYQSGGHYTFDEKEKQWSCTFYNNQNDNQAIYVYDEEDNLLAEYDIDDNGDKVLLTQYDYTYDKEGNKHVKCYRDGEYMEMVYAPFI